MHRTYKVKHQEEEYQGYKALKKLLFCMKKGLTGDGADYGHGDRQAPTDLSDMEISGSTLVKP